MEQDFVIKQDVWYKDGSYHLQTYSEYKDRIWHPRPGYTFGTTASPSDINLTYVGSFEEVARIKKDQYLVAVAQMDAIIKEEKEIEENLKKLREL